MSRFTLAYLRGLTAPEVVISSQGRVTVNRFAQGHFDSALSKRRTKDGQDFIDPIELISRLELVDLVAQLGISHDMDLAELYALGVMSRKFARDSMFSPAELTLRRAITSRVHDIIEQRPELLHPNLRVAKEPSDEGATWMLRFLVLSGVALDAVRLHCMAKREDAGATTLRQALLQGCDIGAPLLEAALKRQMGCLSTALAIVEADDSLPMFDEEMTCLLFKACAAGVSRMQWQFDTAMALLEAIRRRQDIAGGDGNRIRWDGPANPLATIDPSWASARHAHPVVSLVYESTIVASEASAVSASDVAGFPGVPLARAAAALNAIMEPEMRFELSSMSGEQLLKLMVICPWASENGTAMSFWNRPASTWSPNNPTRLVEWAAGVRDSDGQLPSLRLADFHEKQFLEMMGHEHFGALRARLAKNTMVQVLEQHPAVPSATAASAAAPAPARRMRSV